MPHIVVLFAHREYVQCKAKYPLCSAMARYILGLEAQVSPMRKA